MGMFDYKSYSSEESVELFTTAYRLATYANIAGIAGLPTESMVQSISDAVLNSGLYPNVVNAGLPDGWRELTPTDLSLPASAVDSWGQYIIASPITGETLSGPQAKILGEYDAQGNLTRVAVSFTGTNSPVDIVDYFQLNTGELAPNMAPLLTAVRDFVLKNGLGADDVIVTGYSLGGGMANLMAEYRESLVGGFFADANYVGCASPLICDAPGVVLNYGYENDVVYRIVGDEATWQDAIAAGDPGLVNPDNRYDSTRDNIVLFDDMYASPLWSLTPFSIANIPVAWYAHIDGVFSDATLRIANNPFYEFMARDSTTIVANLSALTRGITWVQDKQTDTSDHYGTTAFIIGSQYDDLLQGGVAGDYLYGGAGNDTIKTGAGADRVDGGAGKDNLRLEGSQSDWDVYRLSDGTLFFNAHNGTGLKQAEGVEQISFENEWLSWTRPYDVTASGLEDNRSLISWFDQDVAYRKATEGTTGNDVLSGKAVFGQDGNDVLTALSSGSLLHGGEGNDALKGGSGNDALYGAEGNDVLYASAGYDQLYGGVGDDVFRLGASANNTHIMDFNQANGDHDRLLFAHTVFGSTAALGAAAHQVANDVVIAQGNFHLTVHDALLQEVLYHSAIVVG